MNDLISKQAAIEALNQIFDRCEEIEAHLPEGDPDRTGYKMYPDYMTVWKYLHQLPSAKPLTEEDYTELRDRFGEYVEFVVRDIITGNGERWDGIATGISMFSPLKYNLSYKVPKMEVDE